MSLGSRKQPRVPQQFSVQITAVRDPLLHEFVFVENLSPNGARIITEHPWELGSHVEIKSRMGETQARARIVYCQAVSEKEFGVGLNFLSQTSAWEALRKTAPGRSFPTQGDAGTASYLGDPDDEKPGSGQ